MSLDENIQKSYLCFTITFQTINYLSSFKCILRLLPHPEGFKRECHVQEKELRIRLKSRKNTFKMYSDQTRRLYQ